MSNFKGFRAKDDKFVPGSASDPACGDMGGSKNTEHRDYNDSAHTFNYKGKVTKMGSDYMDFGKKDAQLHGNFDQKDASIAYLKDRNQQGQQIRHFAAGSMESKMYTKNGGVTAYNGNPIRETYTPATSNKPASPDAVRRRIVEKSPGLPTKDQGEMTDKLA